MSDLSGLSLHLAISLFGKNPAIPHMEMILKEMGRSFDSPREFLYLNEKEWLKMKSIYGPVNSRRHGRSLGINLGSREEKLCTWGCLYCQCGIGQTIDLTHSSDPAFKDRDWHDITKDLEMRLAQVGPIDSITFAGNTEPTAHPHFSEIVDEVLRIRSKNNAKWIVNCLTNGSELDSPSKREALVKLDEAWVKLDCASDQMFQRLNRPVERVKSIERHLGFMKLLNPLRVQTMIWDCPEKPHFSNATESNFRELTLAFLWLKPVEIHLTTLARKSATPELKAVDPRRLLEFSQKLRKEGLKVKTFF